MNFPESPHDLIVFLLLMSIPFALVGGWVLYRLVRGHRWRQKELLHTNVAILQTNQAILSALLGAVQSERHRRKPPEAPQRENAKDGDEEDGAIKSKRSGTPRPRRAKHQQPAKKLPPTV